MTDETLWAGADWTAIARYLTNEATPPECEAVERWLGERPERRAAFDDARQAWGTVERVRHRWDGDAMWASLRERVLAAGGADGAGDDEARVGGRGHERAGRWARRGWALGALAGLATAWLVAASPWRAGWSGSSPAVAVPMRTVAAATGQRVAVTLDDGTRVVLNAGSTLRVPRDLRRSRTVEVDGEAMFVVTRRGDAPFVVNVGEARATVLGTAFLVRHYRGERRARVVVTGGRVSVRAAHARAAGVAVVDAHMLAEVTDSGQVILTPDVDADRYTAWTRGRLVFENAPLREVFPELERRYGVVIRTTDSTLAEQRFTVTVADEYPRVIFDDIATVFGVRYARAGDTVTFFRAPSRAPRARRAPRPLEPGASDYGR